MNISNGVRNGLIKGIDKFASTNITETLRKIHINDPDKFIVTSAIMSVVAKDALGCYYYTTQSLNNKRIPEDKRKFVASLDLVNGGLMILTQMTLGLFVDTKTEGWFNKYIKPHFDNAKVGNNLENLKNGLKGTTNLNNKEVIKAISNVEKVSRTGFKLLLSLTASAVIAKRMIVPFIATPLAGIVKEKYMDKKMDAETATDTKGIVPINECLAKPLENKENDAAQSAIDKVLKQNKTEE